MVIGIDVSGNQGNIQWEEVKQANVKFAILKLGNIYDDEPNYVDSKFSRNYKECTKQNMNIGIYVYNYCNNIDSIIEGAKWVVNKMKNKKIQLPIYIDMEDSTLLQEGKEKLTNLCIEFLKIIKENGYKAGVYANLDWFKNYLDDSKFADFSIWVAQTEVNKCDYNGKYDIWQFTHEGQLNGIKGYVDIDYLKNDKLLNNIIENKIVYIVQPGDNLTYIARKYNTTWQEIYNSNKEVIGNNPDLIQIGTKLIIKGGTKDE